MREKTPTPESETPLTDAMQAEQAAAWRKERADLHERIVKAQYHPAVKAPAVVAEAAPPWPDAQPEPSELAAIDREDWPPPSFHLLQPATRRRLTGLALRLLTLAPTGQQRRSWLHSYGSVVLNTLATGQVLGGLDARTTAWLAAFVQTDPAERGAWKDVRADIREKVGLNAATGLLDALTARLDRPGPNVIEVIRRRIAGALDAWRQKHREGEDAAAQTPQARELLKARREAGR